MHQKVEMSIFQEEMSIFLDSITIFLPRRSISQLQKGRFFGIYGVTIVTSDALTYANTFFFLHLQTTLREALVGRDR